MESYAWRLGFCLRRGLPGHPGGCARNVERHFNNFAAVDGHVDAALAQKIPGRVLRLQELFTHGLDLAAIVGRRRRGEDLRDGYDAERDLTLARLSLGRRERCAP